jgi:hypothetical protein
MLRPPIERCWPELSTSCRSLARCQADAPLRLEPTACGRLPATSSLELDRQSPDFHCAVS